MTEAEWLAATNPASMFATVKGRKFERKLRLFAVACCRRIPLLRVDEEVQNALRVAEQFADGLALKPQRRNAHDSVLFGPHRQPAVASALSKVAFEAASRSSETAANKVAQFAVRHFGEPPSEVIAEREAIRRCEREKERRAQAELIRDIFGNPFRPFAVDPSWLTSTAVAIATGIYDDKAFDRLPILADALQDAGCENTDILNHCRQPGEHVRGCWVVDLLTGRS